MANIVTGSMTQPPAGSIAVGMLDRRGFIRHLDGRTEEKLMAIFDDDENYDGKLSKSDLTTMTRRNYCIIAEHCGLLASGAEAPLHAGEARDKDEMNDMLPAYEARGSRRSWSAAAPYDGSTRKYALDIAFRVEGSKKDKKRKITAFGFTIPALDPSE